MKDKAAPWIAVAFVWIITGFAIAMSSLVSGEWTIHPVVFVAALGFSAATIATIRIASATEYGEEEDDESHG